MGFIKDNPIKMDDLGGTPILGNLHMLYIYRENNIESSIDSLLGILGIFRQTTLFFKGTWYP